MLKLEDFEITTFELYSFGRETKNTFTGYKYKEFCISSEDLISDEPETLFEWKIVHLPTACMLSTMTYGSTDTAIETVEELLHLRNNWDITPNDVDQHFGKKMHNILASRALRPYNFVMVIDFDEPDASNGFEFSGSLEN